MSYAASLPIGRSAATSRGSFASQAELTAQTCSCPQAGQNMRALIPGNLRNTLGSVSIAVETARPVLGHLIITELMAEPSAQSAPQRWPWNSWIVTAVRLPPPRR
jgi:hypothetical protein